MIDSSQKKKNQNVERTEIESGYWELGQSTGE